MALERLVEGLVVLAEDVVQHVQRHAAGGGRGRAGLLGRGERRLGRVPRLAAAGLAAGEALAAVRRRGARASRSGGRSCRGLGTGQGLLQEGAAVEDAVDGDEGAEARAFALAQQHLVEGAEPVAELGEAVPLADLVELVLDRLAVRCPPRCRADRGPARPGRARSWAVGGRCRRVGRTKSR